MNRKLERRFQLTTYARDGAEIETRYLQSADLKGHDFSRYDHVLAIPQGWYAFRDHAGKLNRCPLGRSGLGKTALGVIQLLQLEVGAMLTPAEIAVGIQVESLRDNDAMAGRLAAIRRAHLESGKCPRLFLSQRNGGYRIGWNPRASWVWIERVDRSSSIAEEH